jgi:hypothetical protein
MAGIRNCFHDQRRLLEPQLAIRKLEQAARRGLLEEFSQ